MSYLDDGIFHILVRRHPSIERTHVHNNIRQYSLKSLSLAWWGDARNQIFASKNGCYALSRTRLRYKVLLENITYQWANGISSRMHNTGRPVASYIIHRLTKTRTNDPHYSSFVMGIPRWPMSTSQPQTRNGKPFPYHDIIIIFSNKTLKYQKCTCQRRSIRMQ